MAEQTLPEDAVLEIINRAFARAISEIRRELAELRVLSADEAADLAYLNRSDDTPAPDDTDEDDEEEPDEIS
jgi:hypothetical protein